MDYANFTDRMQAGRDAAAYRRNRGEPCGHGYSLVSSSQADEAWLAAYPDEESQRAYYEAQRAHYAAIDVDYDADAMLGEEVGPGLASRARATAAQSRPARTPGERRQRGGNTMTGDDYKRACAAIGISVYASAKLLGVSLRQAQRFGSGEAEVPRAVAIALRLMVKHGETADTIDTPKRRART